MAVRPSVYYVQYFEQIPGVGWYHQGLFFFFLSFSLL